MCKFLCHAFRLDYIVGDRIFSRFKLDSLTDVSTHLVACSHFFCESIDFHWTVILSYHIARAQCVQRTSVHHGQVSNRCSWFNSYSIDSLVLFVVRYEYPFSSNIAFRNLVVEAGLSYLSYKFPSHIKSAENAKCFNRAVFVAYLYFSISQIVVSFQYYLTESISEFLVQYFLNCLIYTQTDSPSHSYQ